ncbi:MAG: primosomal protein N' (replication factor Y) [Pseudohongiellaceae bacterium]|jgi:primosomal protein N' (replication factor Y)
MPELNPQSELPPIYRIAVPSPLRRLFDYLAPPNITEPIALGSRVLIPFGRRQLVGVVAATASHSEFPLAKLKQILLLLDEQPLLPKALLDALVWAADYYQHPLGEVFASALPAKLRSLQTDKKPALLWELADSVTLDEGQNSLGQATRKKQLLKFIAENQPVPSRLVQDAGFATSLLNQLAAKTLISSQIAQTIPPQEFAATNTLAAEPLPLNDQQAAVVATIEKKLNQYGCFLIHGVTGSGKTEIYMQLMDQCLRQGKQCLILIPEIGLTPQTIARFTARFSVPIAVLNSGLNDSERLDGWDKARLGAAAIVIGTRSAVFTPLKNPGLIVIDEEHDSSFKQQDSFRYSARDFALVRARAENIPVILGSATPSLESLSNCKTQKFELLNLTKRAGNAKPASITLVDTAESVLNHGFADTTLDAIKMHLANGAQVLVFLNRRGFAPVISCQSCGWIAECNNCSSYFTLHSNPRGLLCHHCNSARPVPRVCENCQARDLASVGFGTQQIEAFLETQLRDFPVIRVDRDSTRRKNSLDAKLQLVEQGEPCVLIGTQMLAKGHHFPNVSLVAVLDADGGLFSADFRGIEQMGQTIIQVAGRSGRAERRGEVIIQSRHVSHESLQLLTTKTYAEFAEALLEQRKEAMLPPFAHLGLIRIDAPAVNQAASFASRVKNHAQELVATHGYLTELIGPLPAPMEKRAGRFRLHFLVKSPHRAHLQALLTQLCQILEDASKPSSVKWSIDVDPQDLI